MLCCMVPASLDCDVTFFCQRRTRGSGPGGTELMGLWALGPGGHGLSASILVSEKCHEMAPAISRRSVSVRILSSS